MTTIKAPERTLAAQLPPAAGGPVGDQIGDSVVTVTPTQVRRPWRSTARTTFQAIVALAAMFPILVATSGLDPEALPWLAIPVAIAAALTRLMAVPQVEEFLRQFVPFLAAAPSPQKAGRRRGEAGMTDLMAVILVLVVVFVLLLFIFVAPGAGGRC